MKTSKFFLSTLIAASAMTATAYADYTFSSSETVTITSNTEHASVVVNEGVTGTFNITENNRDLKIDSLTLNGDLVVNEPTCALAEIGDISGTGSITLSKTTANNWGGALMLSGDSSGYTGTINIWNGGSASNNSGYYSQFLVLKSANAAGSANVSLGASTVLVVATDSTGIGGLNSADVNTSVVSQATSFAYGGDATKTNPYNFSYGSSLPNNDGTHRFLNITGEGVYEYKGVFGSSENIGGLSLNWSGTGTQTLSGTNYINDLTVSNGTLVLNGTTTIAGTATNAGNLTLGGKVELSSAIQNSGTVTVSDTAVFSLANLTAGEGGVYTLFTNSEGASVSWSGEMGLGNVDLTGTDIAVRGASATFSGAGVTVISGVAADLVWAGTEGNATWNSSATNWLNNESADKFYTGDNVTFGADVENKTVSFESGAELIVGTMSIEDGLNYSFANGVTILGSEFSIGNNAKLSLTNTGTYDFGFDNIILKQNATLELTQPAGKLLYDTITMKAGSVLRFENGNWGGVTIGDATSKILVDATEGSVSLKGSYYGNSSVVAGEILGKGTLNLEASNTQTTNSYTVSATIKDGETDGDKLAVNVALNSGQTVNLTGTNTYSGGTTITSGTLSVATLDALGSGAVSIGSGATLYVRANGTTNTSLGDVTGVGRLVLVSSNVAAGDYLKVSKDEGGWRGTVAFDTLNSGVMLGNYGNANSTIEIGDFSGYWLDQNNGTIVADLVLKGNVDLNNGYGGTKLTVSGDISGSDYSFSYTKTGLRDNGQFFEFNGDINLSSMSFSGEASTKTFNGAVTLSSFTVSGGTVSFKGVTEIGTLNAGDSSVDIFGKTTITGTYTGTGDGSLSVKDGGELTFDNGVTSDTGGTEYINGKISVGAGGTVKFAGHDLMGWGGSETSVVATLEGSTSKNANLYLNDVSVMTFAKKVEMKGNAVISTENESKIDTFGGSIVATGTNNSVSDVEILLRKKFTVEVSGLNDSLLISSAIKDTNNAGSADYNMDKTGLGTLTLSGANEFSRGTLSITAGTLVAANTSALGSGTVSVANGAKLQISVENVDAGTINLASGATLVVDLADFADVLSVDNEMLTILTGTTLTFGDVSAASDTLTTEQLGYLSVTDSSGAFSKYVNKEWSYSDGTLSLTLTIPEPSAFGLLAGVGALALVASRRRRSRR